jgi:hypothetical protein
MRQKDLSEYRERFNKAVDISIRECSRKTGVTDLDTVYQHVTARCSMLVEQLSPLLAEEQIRVIIQKRLKHCSVSVAVADAAAFRAASQEEFEFFKLDVFRKLSHRISFEDPQTGAMNYVEYNRCLQWHRSASIAHLTRRRDADDARIAAEIASDAFLQPLVEQWGDLPAEDLARRWFESQRDDSLGAAQ